MSDYAPYLPSSDEGQFERVTRARSLEDDGFVEMLLRRTGAKASQISLVDWRMQDFPLRWGMEAAATLESTDLREEEVAALRERIAKLPADAVVLAPAAVGGHIDHRLVREAALLSIAPERLVLYEDLPYACRAASDDGDVMLRELQQVWLPAGESMPGLLRDFSNCYPSQIAPDVADEMQTYAALHGGRQRFFGSAAALNLLRALAEDAA